MRPTTNNIRSSRRYFSTTHIVGRKSLCVEPLGRSHENKFIGLVGPNINSRSNIWYSGHTSSIIATTRALSPFATRPLSTTTSTNSNMGSIETQQEPSLEGMSARPFHLAIPVHNLEKAKEFYGGVLGLKEGRSSEKWYLRITIMDSYNLFEGRWYQVQENTLKLI